MTPLEQYQADLQRQDFFQDAAQLRAVEALDDLYHRLLAEPSGGGLFGRFRKPRPQMGLYMWGGVGRGKTYLMDNLSIPSLPTNLWSVF